MSVATLHVLPIGDLIEHEGAGDDCVCGPAVEHVPGDGDSWIIVHHALDGREAEEP